MSKKVLLKDWPLKLKKWLLFSFALFFIFLPGQNWYFSLPLEAKEKNQEVLTYLPQSSRYPVNLAKVPLPDLTVQAAMVLDVGSGTVLYRFNEDFPLLPASTVKIMTALVALDHYSLDQIIEIGKIESFGQTIDFKVGQKFYVRDLLLALLVASANDAAEVLAQNYPGGKEAFVRAMNEKAESLSMSRTHFANPTGLDSDVNEHKLKDFSLTTALDLSRLARVALRDKFITQTVDKTFVVVTDLTTGQEYPLYNINILLNKRPEIKGIKTGWTEEAGECLVALAQKEEGSLVTVVLGSQDRFGETEKLIDWAYANFSWQLVIEPTLGPGH